MAAGKRRSRGHIEQLPSGSYRAIVFAGVDPLTGRSRQLKETAATRKDAEKALTRLQGQVDENRQPKSSITVGLAVAQWLDVADLQPTTRERYDDLIRLYILPTFGQLQAGKLDAELLERFYARLQRCRTLCNGKTRAGHDCEPHSTALSGGVTSGSTRPPSPRRQRQARPSRTHRAPMKPRRSSTRRGAIRNGACCSG
ncbi:hypothetical protein [Pseudonocardia endophytica]|uniref:hypothetical protein n=1 Tax=Pseudonocardia endophytica TaxID=401976 RepID=UPI001A9E42C7|nr:hypothetical protein [Pseudonocardia endophytica]